MNYRLMGRTGVRVSELCLGTMTFGNEADEQTAFAIMDRALDVGINHFDTANIYNQGRTEEIVGRWMKAYRDSIVLASKVFFPMGNGVNDCRSSRRHILASVEQSLRRLQTDRLDILYLHHWDNETALEESLGAMDTLVQQGKVHYVGLSNFAAWQVVKAEHVSREHGFASVVCIQPMYNLVKRIVEVEILPMAQHENLAVFPYSPIGSGLLSGKYLKGGSGRIHESAMYAERYKADEYKRISGEFVALARKHGWSPAALAVAWVGHHPAVTAPIIGARNMDQFNDTLQCLDIDMTDALWEKISAIAGEPPLATDREPMGATLAQVKSGSHTGKR